MRIRNDENWSKKAVVTQEELRDLIRGKPAMDRFSEETETEKESQVSIQSNPESESTALSASCAKDECDLHTHSQTSNSHTVTLRRSTRHIRKAERLNV